MMHTDSMVSATASVVLRSRHATNHLKSLAQL